jgi:hypothetical protein
MRLSIELVFVLFLGSFLGCETKNVLSAISVHENSCILAQIVPAIRPLVIENQSLKAEFQREVGALKQKVKELEALAVSEKTSTCITCKAVFRHADNAPGCCPLVVHQVSFFFFSLSSTSWLI